MEERTTIEEVDYILCKDMREEEIALDLPPMMYGIWFSRLCVTLTMSPVEEATYKYASSAYAHEYLQKHRKMMEAVIAPFYQCPLIEPGAGGGVVCAIRGGVVSGDPFPPKGAHHEVQTERFASTVKRGAEDGIIICSYIRNFLTESDLMLIKGRKVVWIDSVRKILPGRQIVPGVSYENIPPEFIPERICYPDSAIKDEMLWYSENLLNRENCAIYKESEYSNYLRVMRPLMTIATLEGYIGGFESKEDSDCILATTVEEVLRALSDKQQRRVYFAQVGREVTKIRMSGDLLIAPGKILVHYERRQIYDVTNVVDLFSGCAIEKCGERYYFYDRSAENVTQAKEIRRPNELIKYKLVGLEKVEAHGFVKFSVSGDRLHVDAAPFVTQFLFRGRRVDFYFVVKRIFAIPPPMEKLKELINIHNSLKMERIMGDECARLLLLEEDHWVMGLNTIYLDYSK